MLANLNLRVTYVFTGMIDISGTQISNIMSVAHGFNLDVRVHIQTRNAGFCDSFFNSYKACSETDGSHNDNCQS